MKQVQSADGTTIAYDQIGHGPAVILVDGALGSRAGGILQHVTLLLILADGLSLITCRVIGTKAQTDSFCFSVLRQVMLA